MESSFLPSLSSGAQALLRIAYGALLIVTLGHAAVHWRRFFVSGRGGGYYDPTDGFFEKVHSVCGAKIVLLLWFGAAVCLVCNIFTPAAAAINLILCRHYFVDSRWNSLSRGFGAPGFMSYWLSMWILVFEMTARYAASCHSFAVFAAQIDFSLIMLSAGLYKMLSGYANNHGMEYGMVNPQWGYFYSSFKKMSPDAVLFKFLNHMAWSTEVVAAILMWIPQTRILGAVLIFLSFAFIATQIRLGVLCEIVMTCCVVFVPANSQLDVLISALVPHTVQQANDIEIVVQIAYCFIGAYLLITPMVHCCLFFNLFAKKRVPEPLQAFVDKYANIFGIIVWRVFSADLTNFFIRIYAINERSGERKLISRYGYSEGIRFSFVCESIVITSLFTLRKYYPSDLKLFEERLIRYANTLPQTSSGLFEFEYLSVQKEKSQFAHIPIATYLVDLHAQKISEVLLEERADVTRKNVHSPLYAGPKAGSYAPVMVK